jgi:hypothetical protein
LREGKNSNILTDITRHLIKPNTFYTREKTLRTLGVQGNHLHMIKGIYENPTNNITLSSE